MTNNKHLKRNIITKLKCSDRVEATISAINNNIKEYYYAKMNSKV
ncbi:MAG: hypothetical protein E6940_06380 [Clostridium septicum]|nr:hypothetical protein [Clostridium septicum]MDU1313673.1 hypothetical protein [Clostridium septicum]